LPPRKAINAAAQRLLALISAINVRPFLHSLWLSKSAGLVLTLAVFVLPVLIFEEIVVVQKFQNENDRENHQAEGQKVAAPAHSTIVLRR